MGKKAKKTIVEGFDAEVDIEDLMGQIGQIGRMREKEDAAVDTMGCDKLYDEGAEPRDRRFQILLSLMLSSQTKDEVTSAAMKRLKERGCTIENLTRMQQSELEELLRPVSFYKTKAKHILEATATLKEKWGGDIPESLDGLISLKGVGPKMAHLVMQSAWGQTLGIAVDTHVHRICNRLGWVTTSTPEQTRLSLQRLIPQEEWSRINKLLVGFGQQVCRAVRPCCGQCLLAETCPSSKVRGRKEEGRSRSRSPPPIAHSPTPPSKSSLMDTRNDRHSPRT